MASAEQTIYPPWLYRLMQLSQQAHNAAQASNPYNPLLQAGNNIASQYGANTEAMYGPGPQAPIPGIGYAQNQAAQYGDQATAASTLGIGARPVSLALLMKGKYR